MGPNPNPVCHGTVNEKGEEASGVQEKPGEERVCLQWRSVFRGNHCGAASLLHVGRCSSADDASQHVRVDEWAQMRVWCAHVHLCRFVYMCTSMKIRTEFLCWAFGRCLVKD